MSHPSVIVPTLSIGLLDLGRKGVYVDLDMAEGQILTFVLRSPLQKTLSEFTQPTRMQADRLGVAFEGDCLLLSLRSCIIAEIVLLSDLVKRV